MGKWALSMAQGMCWLNARESLPKRRNTTFICRCTNKRTQSRPTARCKSMRGEQYIYISQQPKREIFVKFCFNVYFSISFLFFVFETFRISVVVVARILSSPFHSSFSCSYGIWRHDMAKWLDHATITNRRKNVDFCDFFFLCSLYFVWTPTHASECTKKKRGTWKLRTWRTRRVVMRIPLWKLCVLSIESVIGADFCCNKPAFHWYQHFSVVVHRRSGWKTDCNPRESKSSVCSVCVCANMQIRNSSSSFFFCLSLMLSHTVYCSDGSNSDLIVFPVFLGCLACVCIMSSCGCA